MYTSLPSVNSVQIVSIQAVKCVIRNSIFCRRAGSWAVKCKAHECYRVRVQDSILVRTKTNVCISTKKHHTTFILQIISSPALVHAHMRDDLLYPIILHDFKYLAFTNEKNVVFIQDDEGHSPEHQSNRGTAMTLRLSHSMALPGRTSRQGTAREQRGRLHQAEIFHIRRYLVDANVNHRRQLPPIPVNDTGQRETDNDFRDVDDVVLDFSDEGLENDGSSETTSILVHYASYDHTYANVSRNCGRGTNMMRGCHRQGQNNRHRALRNTNSYLPANDIYSRTEPILARLAVSNLNQSVRSVARTDTHSICCACPCCREGTYAALGTTSMTDGGQVSEDEAPPPYIFPN